MQVVLNQKKVQGYDNNDTGIQVDALHKAAGKDVLTSRKTAVDQIQTLDHVWPSFSGDSRDLSGMVHLRSQRRLGNDPPQVKGVEP